MKYKNTVDVEDYQESFDDVVRATGVPDVSYAFNEILDRICVSFMQANLSGDDNKVVLYMETYQALLDFAKSNQDYVIFSRHGGSQC